MQLRRGSAVKGVWILIARDVESVILTSAPFSPDSVDMGPL